ncbi:MAG: hypothetical protein IPN62_13940 [Flavobacteriales bacterium]|nr:hypothetical protein [Flavobacteriales bacterium]
MRATPTRSENGTTYTQSGTYTSVTGCSTGDPGADHHTERQQHYDDHACDTYT